MRMELPLSYSYVRWFVSIDAGAGGGARGEAKRGGSDEREAAEQDLLNRIGPDGDPDSELLNAKALSVIGRVESKLTGKDFNAAMVLDVSAQVERLIREATSHINLSQCYIGWYVPRV